MIWFILYIAGASGSVFAMTYLTSQLRYANMEPYVLFILGALWPVMAPMYIAYALARIKTQK